jgi:ABC-type multidrug transport system fused ATPase/permease subunit
LTIAQTSPPPDVEELVLIFINKTLTYDNVYLFSKMEELKEQSAKEASLLDIWQFSKPEQGVILIGLLCTFMRGLSTPVFSILYGRLFNSLSNVFSSKPADITHENLVNAISFALLGFFAGLTTFFSGALFGYVGEKLSKRLRTNVFGSLLRQDGKFYDDARHSTGKLSARLASDAPNVQAAVDQRLGKSFLLLLSSLKRHCQIV